MRHYWEDLNLVAATIIQQIPLSSYQIHYVPHMYQCSTNKTYPQSDVFFCKEAICKACLSCTLNIWDSQIFEEPAFETSILKKVIKKISIGPEICWYWLISNVTQSNSVFMLMFLYSWSISTQMSTQQYFCTWRRGEWVIWVHVMGPLTFWKVGLPGSVFS